MSDLTIVLDSEDSAPSLEDRLLEVLDEGEREALLEVWLDPDTGCPVIAINGREPHFEIDGQAACTPVYHSEH